MSFDDPLRRYKTDAWKDPAAVAYYRERVTENVGVNRLKNAVETEIITRWARGNDVIDVGIGTGRASIPLALAGKNVTGVDSSQAMLDRARADAAPASIRTLLGDIEELPVPAAAFDTLVSLNVAQHFPRWQRYLLEWKRVVRPGGRLIFDVHNLEHVDAVAAYTGIARETLVAGERSFGTFVARVSWRELVAFCGVHDLAVEAIVPHGLFYSTRDISFHQRDGLATGEQLERLLAAMAVDDRFFAFGRFLHHELIGHLTPETTGSMTVVLKNAPDAQANAAFVARTEALNALFGDAPTFEQLAPYLGLPAGDWRAEASRHLEHAPNLVFAAILLTAMPFAWTVPALFDAALGPAFGERLRSLRELHELDKAVHDLGNAWFDPAVTYDGVQLGAVARYYVTEELLAPSAAQRAAALG